MTLVPPSDEVDHVCFLCDTTLLLCPALAWLARAETPLHTHHHQREPSGRVVIGDVLGDAYTSSPNRAERVALRILRRASADLGCHIT